MVNTTAARAADKLDRVWATLSAGDRIVLLGHDRDELTAADKQRLAALAQAVGRRTRRGRRR
jgi:hypothetical protein